MNFHSWWAATDAVGIVVFLALVGMSLASWYVGLTRISRRLRARRSHQDFLAAFHGTANLTPMLQLSLMQPPHQPYARLAREVFFTVESHRRPGPREVEAEAIHPFLHRIMGQAVEREQAGLERGMTLLSTIASTAPFIGLFGTVWGIHHALGAIARSGQAGLTELAGPVGEALVMTGFGLFVAVPAVLAHNWLARDNRLVMLGMSGFVHALFTRLSTGHAVGASAHEPPRPSHNPTALAS